MASSWADFASAYYNLREYHMLPTDGHMVDQANVFVEAVRLAEQERGVLQRAEEEAARNTASGAKRGSR